MACEIWCTTTLVLVLVVLAVARHLRSERAKEDNSPLVPNVFGVLCIVAVAVSTQLSVLWNLNESSQVLDIPTIDLTPFRSPIETDSETMALRHKVARELALACSTVGVFYVSGHGLPYDGVSEGPRNIFNAASEFWRLSQDSKERISIRPGGFTRGYIGMGGESGSQLLEVKEAFSYGYSWGRHYAPGAPELSTFNNSLQGRNVWPSTDTFPGTESWKETLGDFYDANMQVSHLLVRAFSLALGHEESFLLSLCEHGHEISLMRLFHYFANSKESPRAGAERIGSSPHTDWGFLTLIVQDSVSGLELFYKDRWRPVPPKPDTIVVNCGDFLSVISKGRFISPLHRVASGPEERQSAVLFFYPSFETTIAKAQALVGHADSTEGSSLNLSLFADQRESSGETQKHALAYDLEFGTYITQKWSQVFRNK